MDNTFKSAQRSYDNAEPLDNSEWTDGYNFLIEDHPCCNLYAKVTSARTEKEYTMYYLTASRRFGSCINALDLRKDNL